MDENYKIDQHWKVINAGGRTVSNTPEQLWEAAVDYFQWCDNNPITYKRTLTSGKEAGKSMTVEAKRPYSVKALCLHCSISERYLEDLRTLSDRSSEWYMVVEKIWYVIYTDNLEGALIDLYSPIMVAKVLKMDAPIQDNDEPVKIEMVDSRSNELSISENEVLKKLDFGKVELLKEKIENPQR